MIIKRIAAGAACAALLILAGQAGNDSIHAYNGTNAGVVVGGCGFEYRGNPGWFCGVDQ